VLVVVVSAVGWLARPICTVTVAQPADDEAKQTNAAGAEPNPEHLLRQMSEYLCNLPAVSCRIKLVIRIQASGMDNRMTSKMALRLQRPNRLALVLEEGMMGMTWSAMVRLSRSTCPC
jgi:hypothetical protein